MELGIAPYDLIWTIIVGAILVLMLWAWADLFREVRERSLSTMLLWYAVVTLIPVLGPLAWFAVGRTRRGARRAAVPD